ncbi:MAG: saccharopine dehydrogenase family protein [Candidatus Zhuqueibacterota bacterium]
MKKVVVLGAGMVGAAMAKDLTADVDVTSVDVNSENLSRLAQQASVHTIEADLSDPAAVKKLVADFDLVIGAVPGFMGFKTLQAVIEAGKNSVDISFFEEDPFELDALAKKHNVVAVMDCGVAPGMSNLFLGYHNSTMEVESFECSVGGLPLVRSWPFEYKAPFSPIDVIEEYIRPAKILIDGKIHTRPALSEPELVHFGEIGTLESFNTDGLRTLLKTINVPNMKEKTLRYPGHIEKMRVLREIGFFSKQTIEVNGCAIRPLDLTTRLLFPFWKLGADEQEFTVMKIKIAGQESGVRREYVYDLLDRFDPTTQISSMARTTGYPCTAVARLILAKRFARVGINPPEFVGADEGCFQFVLDYQKAKNIHYRKTVRDID